MDESARRQPQRQGAARTVPAWLAVVLTGALAGLLLAYHVFIGDLYAQAAAAFRDALPRAMAALVVLILGLLLAAVLRRVLTRTMKDGRRRYFAGTVTTYMVYAVAVVVAVFAAGGQLAGLALSMGLVGFGLTLALQTPILCAVGWFVVNSRRLYAPGDRVTVGEVKGDVMEVNLLTTTLWEFGVAGMATGDRPSGRRVTFPNKIVLEQPVYNHSADFPYVWDELVVPVAMEGDWRLAREILLQAADEVVGNDRMAALVEQYEGIIAARFAPYDLARTPSVTMRLADSWVNMVLRYLVHVDQRGRVRTRLIELVLDRFNAESDRLPPVYNRIQPMHIDGSGRPVSPAPPAR